MDAEEWIPQIRHWVNVSAYRAGRFFRIEIDAFERKNSVVLRKAEISGDAIGVKTGGVDNETSFKIAGQSFYLSVLSAEVGGVLMNRDAFFQGVLLHCL